MPKLISISNFGCRPIMRKSFVVLGLLLLLVSAAAAQGKSKSWLRGSWAGTGYQTDTDGEST
jgi:hypothetical protein